MISQFEIVIIKESIRNKCDKSYLFVKKKKFIQYLKHKKYSKIIKYLFLNKVFLNLSLQLKTPFKFNYINHKYNFNTETIKVIFIKDKSITIE